MKEEAYHASCSDNKDKVRSYSSDMVVLEHQMKAFDAMVPLIKKVQKNVKSIAKSKEAPEEYVVELSTIVYFSGFYNMPSFERVKAQLAFRYGQKWVDNIIVKGKTTNVDDDVKTNMNYKAKKSEVSETSKEVKQESKVRAKQEAKEIEASNQALVTSLTTMPSFSSTPTGKKGGKKGKRKPSTDKKAAAKKAAAAKKKKESSSEEDYSDEYYSDYDSEYSESEEEKPKKKSKKEKKEKKEEKKEKKEEKKAPVKLGEEKEEKSKSKSDSDSDDIPAAAEPVSVPAEENPAVAKEEKRE